MSEIPEGFAMLADGKRHWVVNYNNVLCGSAEWNFELILDTNLENPRNCEHCMQCIEANNRLRMEGALQ